MPTPSQAIVEALSNHGVSVIFSLSGNQIMPIYDACIDVDIRIIHTRNEASAVYMAEAYAQMSGNIGVALVTAGPGLLNAVSALYSAARSETPVLLLSGDAALAMDGRGGFQELDQMSVTSPITKKSVRPSDPKLILSSLTDCIHTALNGTPGPVHLALAFDVLDSKETLDPILSPILTNDTNPMSEDDLTKVLDALRAAKRPLLITGPQANSTRQPIAFKTLSNELGMPLICLESARGLSDSFYGDLGTVLETADLIIHLGKVADYSTGVHAKGKIAPGTSIISILTDDQNAPKLNTEAEKTLNLNTIRTGNIPATMLQLAAAIDKNDFHKPDPEWSQRLTAAISQRLGWQAGERRHPASLSADLNEAIAKTENAILIADGGEFCQWVQAECNAPRRMINGPSGAIGGGIAYAIGASIACPAATIFLVMGDGTAGFYFAEINTAVRAGCNIVAVIGNDYRWNAEVQIQIDNYGPDRVYGCDLDASADYAAAARGFGAYGATVSEKDNFSDALDTAIAHAGPAILNVLIDSQASPKFAPMKL